MAGTGRTIECWLEAERDQLVLWLPVMLGGGIALWFALPDAAAWRSAILGMLAIGLACVATGRGGRAARVVALGMAAAALGLGLIWFRADLVAAPVLGGPTIARFSASVEVIEPLVARKLVRLTLLPVGEGADSAGRAVALPHRIRVNLAERDAPVGLGTGAVVRLRARLMPPPLPAVPGAYDFARVAWFSGIGATGRGFAPVVVTASSGSGAGIRVALSRHIVSRLEGSAGGIAAALATGDVGAITEDDSEAMRRAGLAHLLSVSGLHITAAVAATMLIVMRLFALSPWLALHARLPVIAALAGAAAAIGYTLLTGSQVPTIRSCVAALLVLVALAMGREAMTLRLVATGAMCVMLVLPESAAGPSFQLSFAAITAIMAFHEHPAIRTFFGAHDEGRVRKLGRGVASLLLTGLLVEVALMPIAVFHFHKSGLYGAFANIIAIPLTTFVVMPLEALALLLDVGGMGAPVWWLVQTSLDALLWLAHRVADAPGSVRALPAMPSAAFALMIIGGIWIALWRTRWRRLGGVPLAVGAIWALTTPPPDILVTGDGRHVAVRTAAGLAMLRDRAGDYTRAMLAENGGVDGEPLFLADQPDARCSRDLCVTDIAGGGRTWRVLATRSAYMVPIDQLLAACRTADIVVSERNLPRRCTPRWLRLDRNMLRRTGGVAVTLGSGRVETILSPGDRHPWRDPPRLDAGPRPARRFTPPAYRFQS
ncbi:Competence protein ComEC [Sphingomonas aurantiaca]|uniref:Competence protein ComEC n=1 Tax=Sphingomonas aurantiaca TaxID=185949 RepID=A0A5E7ZX25_9SPHN|nr:ComEC/Rec2 family competence protein [Sphingomonas aurantiaca]VVT23251.1 Competence protein ComEC [Sphingomonas aurantiaca]